MNIIVAGYIVAYPFAGMTWCYLHFLLGLKKLGHEVWFLEDSGEYSLPYDPVKQVCDADSNYGRAYLERVLARFGLSGRWCYYSQFENKFYGLSEAELDRLCRRTDLFLNVAAVNQVRPMYAQARRKVAIDTDPVFNQIRLAQGDEYLWNFYRGHDAYFTFGPHLAEPGQCEIPTAGIVWCKTCQPIHLDFWRAAALPPSDAPFTTIMQWKSYQPVNFAGRHYGQKDVEFRKLLHLPRCTPQPLEVAVTRGAPEDELRSEGWQLADSLVKTATLESYRDYIVSSRGEWGIAKNGYVEGRTGSFGDRSACYLACARPVLAQDTGFGSWLPVGEGLLTFNDIESAVEGLARINADYPRHAAAARRIAEEYFDSDKVLGAMLEACG